jgi:hypothetical protein
MRHIQEHVLVDCDIRRTLYTVGSLINLLTQTLQNGLEQLS